MPVRFGGRGKAYFVPTPILAQTLYVFSVFSQSFSSLQNSGVRSQNSEWGASVVLVRLGLRNDALLLIAFLDLPRSFFAGNG